MKYKFPTRWDRFKKWITHGDQEVVTRIHTFKCWLIYGHRWDKTGSSRPASGTMNKCVICGKVVSGPDPNVFF